jgi:YidC/Oxa1 family membrane protein insertase
MQPMVNVLIVLSSYLFSNFGLAIIALTIIIRGCMYPLTLKQLRASKAMQVLQPKLAELQKKYAKDKQKLGREQMKLYRESGVSPLGCLVPMLVQLPVWIALYQSIIRVLSVAPEDFLGLSKYLYSWTSVYSALPLNSNFLWLNLAVPDKFMILPILVGGTMWVQQKMVQPPTTDPKQKSTSSMMLWMMPLLFAVLSLQFPSGLALYWVVSNVITIVIQYFITGWGGLVKTTAKKSTGGDKKYRKRIAQIEDGRSDYSDVGADITDASSTREEGLGNGKSRDGRKDRGGSYPTRSRRVRNKPRRSKSNRPKRR